MEKAPNIVHRANPQSRPQALGASTQVGVRFMNDKPLTIAILGGAGKEGSGLALRWGNAGHRVIIGSRSTKRASGAAAELNEELDSQMISGADNREAAAACDIAVLAVPYPAQQETALAVADLLKGKILIDVTAPLKPPKVGTVQPQKLLHRF